MAKNPNFQNHKLCGFFCAVLSVNSAQTDENLAQETLPPGTPCSLFQEGTNVGFRSDDGRLTLLPAVGGGSSAEEIDREDNAESSCSFSGADLGKFGVSECSRKRKRRTGLAQRSNSAVHQVHALKANKCLEIEARVVRVLVRDGEVRAVILLDVYLPMAVWSGWQFPKSRGVAASLFRHLSCNWEERNSLLVCGYDHNKYIHDEECIWSHPDCCVLGCKMHCTVPFSTNRNLFELHEIFKSLPTVGREGKLYPSRIKQENPCFESGIWDLSDDLLTNVLTALGPKDLVRVAATCHHLRSLTASIMPCMKLKLFPHQQAAVEWMLQRERNPQVVPHPLYMDFATEDGFHFFVNVVSGEILTGVAPTVTDCRGGMFCDEPGLGKTITALSLILKTQGTLADPPDGAEVVWCMHNTSQRCGYYELSSDHFTACSFMSTWKRCMGKNGRKKQIFLHEFSSEFSSGEELKASSTKRTRLKGSELSPGSIYSPSSTLSLPATRVMRCTRSLRGARRNLLDKFESSALANGQTHKSKGQSGSQAKQVKISHGPSNRYNKLKKATSYSDLNETWVQCDACSKWRKISDGAIPDATSAWFCSMNSDTLYQSCAIPEESWNYKRSITDLPGFYTKGTLQGKDHNISFFENVLKEHCTLINSETMKALTWLANLSSHKLSEMETTGLRRPSINSLIGSDGDGYHKVFQAFGLIRKIEKNTSRWYYPCTLVDNLALDVTALRIALTKPLNSFRLYLSRATLIVVPSNLVDHWRTQILKHVKPGQLQIFVWTDKKTPPAHNLAWDYDVVITTFNRLSAEWGPRKRSLMMQVHWLRVILDEGHTLGSSLSLTNKLQMAISLESTNRWLLTGTPTPNTPNSQVAHLQPMLKFLREEAYGQNQKSWEAGILRPFEAEMEDARVRLLQLLQRCMISARKIDLQAIPPCVKKVTFLNFTEQHAKSYNELVVTVRRNILMADWNDPSHVESLLNPKQWKFRSTTIRNVRLSCCVAGHIKVTDAGQDIHDTMDILVEQGLDPVSEEYVLLKYSLLNGGNCFRCKEWCRLPVITPCKHLLCLDCVALNSEKCTFPGCGNSYEMQNPEILTRPENPNPKWPVPKDLIELQPSYKQDDWDPDWHATSSSKVAYLVDRLKSVCEANRKMGYCLELDGNADLMNPFGEAPLSFQKGHTEMAIHHKGKHMSNDNSYKLLPEKVIIFSQFLEHIHVIEQQLTGAGIKYAGMYSPMHSSNKLKSLMIFQHDPNCMVLLMDGSAALGLDLSFVSLVFLMEPIWDRSVEEQVISRAHRMGATRPVRVETLAMRGTIEEQMVQLLQNADEFRRTLKQEFHKGDHEAARARRTLHDFAENNYLSHLSFVRTNVTI